MYPASDSPISNNSFITSVACKDPKNPPKLPITPILEQF